MHRAKASLNPESIVSVNRKIGEGSFGQVFEGTLSTKAGDVKVVMKRMKPTVERALEMGEIEIALNKASAKRAKGACADYLGYMEVNGKSAQPSVGLSEGLWLVWKYQGYKTLESYLRQRDFLQRLSYDLEVMEVSVIPTVMKQILDSLQKLHEGRIVHRDLKPMNLLFCEDDRRFRFIDLGACVDMSSGVNFSPEESIFDPTYCAPEKYIMPTSTPDFAEMSGPMQSLSCWSAWKQHSPDRFDMYSAGLVLMQLAVPKLRTQRAIKNFSEGLSQYNYDPREWASRQQLPARETFLLDEDNGAGWELAAALLRERVVEKKQARASTSTAPRPSAREALRFRFLKQADRRLPPELNPTLSSTSSYDEETPGAARRMGGVLQGLFSRTFDSEDEELDAPAGGGGPQPTAGGAAHEPPPGSPPSPPPSCQPRFVVDA
eukprot:CAMPEP_0177605224 /NCGR_PEP_ID=MMETSP0419_2-20121207/16580_1 /TAXON_ID=582737 /ORGANISM="Tetraselmis sp., Strain GSL018" /LENGTH=433 /DNA_ID=CAMNT_0019099345 /DNA_START=452 /DNA_END=1751 /DNA_ORIENTATION=-